MPRTTAALAAAIGLGLGFLTTGASSSPLSTRASSSSVVAAALRVDLAGGCHTYVGQTGLDGVSSWLGMRYAAPPTGDLRFRPPVDPECNDGDEGEQEADEVSFKKCFLFFPFFFLVSESFLSLLFLQGGFYVRPLHILLINHIPMTSISG